MAKRVIFGKGRDKEILVGIQRKRLRLHIHRRVARGLEHIAVAVGAGQAVSDGRFDDQYLFVFFRDGQHCLGHTRGRRSDGKQNLVITVGFGQYGACDIWFELGILDNHLDRAPVDFVRAFGGVFQPQLEPRLGLFRECFKAGTGQPVYQRDLY